MGHYEVCIIGAGMVGSAAAKYCKLLKNDQKIILIGPEEPKKQDYHDTKIFASYYDEGRITGHLDSDDIWCHMHKESIKRYRDIEAHSKINFFVENGYLNLYYIGDGKLETFRKVLQSQEVPFEEYANADELKRKFPFLNITENMCGLYEPTKAGTLNPRRLVEAQQRLATDKGVVLLRDIVTKVQRSSQNHYEISTATNGTITATKVLLCAGAFLFHNPIIPPGIHIDIKANLVTAGLIPVHEKDLYKFTNMPSVSLMSRVSGPSDSNPFGEAFSVTAPIKYPDGIWYAKVVLRGDLLKKDSYTPKEVTQWYRDGCKMVHNLQHNLAVLVKNFLPDIEIDDEGKIIVYTCSLMETPNYRPYLDKISDNFYIFTGCNGNSARCSDEFGRLAAKLTVSDEWDCPFDRNECKCLYEEKK